MKIGLSTCGFTPDEEAFRKLAEAGIHAVEISMEKWHLDQLDFAAVKSYADTYGIEIWSCHLPFYPFEALDPSAEDATLRENTLHYFEGVIAKGTSVGIKLYVVHPSGEPIAPERRPVRKEHAKDSLSKLAAIAETRLLTMKPIIYVANVSEDDVSGGYAENPAYAKLKAHADSENAVVVNLCVMANVYLVHEEVAVTDFSSTVVVR